MKKYYFIFLAIFFFILCLYAVFKLHKRIEIMDYNNQRAINSIQQILREEALFEITENHRGRRIRIPRVRGDRQIIKLTFIDGEEKTKNESWSYKILDQGISVQTEEEIVFYPYSSIKKINFQTD